MKTVRDFDVKGKRVLVRCDFNVPLNENGSIADDFRIRATLPTLEFLRSRGAKIILLAHLGEPNGMVQKNLSLQPVQEKLAEFLGISVGMADNCIGEEVQKRTNLLLEGEVLLLENVRFHKEEQGNDANFARELALNGEIFVNDAFAACHRAHASIAGIANFLPSCAGLLVEKEAATLGKFLKNPEHPFVVVAGGKKVKDKLSFIDHISGIADFVLLGNLLQDEAARQHMQFLHQEKIVLPVDRLPSKGQALDIGPKTTELFCSILRKAKSIFWNGPLGLVENQNYVQGSIAVANAIVQSHAYSIAGGGDISSFLNAHGFADKFSYVSTGGGATLEFLAGEELPGLKVLGYYG